MMGLLNFAARQNGLPGIITCMAPDVCKTPTPGGPIPIPYMIVSMLSFATMTDATVSTTALPTFTLGSRTTQSIGDEPGTLGGVVSSVFKGWCRPITFDPTILVGGQPIVRNNDMFEMNCAGPMGPSNTVGRLTMMHPK